MPDPSEIWLQPWCDRCERNSGEQGRLWCQDDVWGRCDECGASAVKYSLSTGRKKEKRADA